MFKKLKSLFKKHVEVKVIDDSITLHFKDIKPFLDKEVKDKISDIDDVVRITYKYLDQELLKLKNAVSKSKTEYVKNLKKIVDPIKIPLSDHYFEAHVFASDNLKLMNGFMYKTKNVKKQKQVLEQFMNVREIILNLKHVIDKSNLIFYDVVLEEISKRNMVIPKSVIEIQIYKLTGKKVTLI